MITDIQSDKNLGVLIKAAQRLVNKDFAEEVYELGLQERSFDKLASSNFALERTRQFPLNSPEDTILSKIYFDYTHTKLAEYDRDVVKDRIDTYLNLYNIPEDLFETYQEKSADEKTPRYLLPSLETCAVHDKGELQRAGHLFVKEAHKLALNHRVEFAQEFSKLASEMDHVPYPKEIAKYAGLLDTDLTNLAYMLEVRGAAVQRAGKDGSAYTKLAHAVMQVEESPKKQELTKLANTINKLDQIYGLDSPRYENKLPDAFSIVFNKEAEETSTEKVPDKSTIVAEYGLDALEAVEMEDGTIDTEKLKLIKNKYAT